VEGIATLEPVVTERLVLTGNPGGLYALERDTGRLRWWLRSDNTLCSPVIKTHIALIPLTALLITACEGGMSRAKATSPPFGGDQDVEYASVLWQQLKQDALVGKGALESTPYTGHLPPRGHPRDRRWTHHRRRSQR
jgi:hypothetical protein